VTHHAAGLIVRARSTGRYLFVLRSDECDHPGEWAGVGGSAESGETPAETALREFREETAHTGHIALGDCVCLDGYMTYIAHVTEEFEPRLNWEADAHVWATRRDLPSPMHPGVEEALTWLL
jgi:8-oxo-dGTP pyrophosphatase MutT (NUDIX family)